MITVWRWLNRVPMRIVLSIQDSHKEDKLKWISGKHTKADERQKVENMKG